jgi:hypothetical protein
MTYKATLQGTPEQWEKKLKDIKDRGHEILHEGKNPYKGDIGFGEDVYAYWAEVKIPS